MYSLPLVTHDASEGPARLIFERIKTRMQQQPLFRTGKERMSRLREIDRKNLQAARIILESKAGGLMEEWARMIVKPRPGPSEDRDAR